MKTTLSISPKGQITIPPAVRKDMGLQQGDFLVMERAEGGWLLKPAMVVEVEIYSDAKLKRMAELDAWTPAERKAWLKSIGAKPR